VVWKFQPAGREWTGWLRGGEDGQQHESWNKPSCLHLRPTTDEGMTAGMNALGLHLPPKRAGIDRCTPLITLRSDESIGIDCCRLGNVNGDCKERTGGGCEVYGRMCQNGTHSECRRRAEEVNNLCLRGFFASFLRLCLLVVRFIVMRVGRRTSRRIL